jgi:hypothetical protein
LFTNLIVNFNLQFDHVSCNLLRAISQSKLQYSQQCCNIPRKRTSGLTVNDEREGNIGDITENCLEV